MGCYNRLTGLIVALLILTAAPSAAQSTMDVRVRLFDQAEPLVVSIASQDGPISLYAGDHEDELVRLEEGETSTLSRASNQLYVRIGEYGIFAHALRIEPSPGARMVLAVEEGRTPTPARSYSGLTYVSLEGADQQLQLINEINLEDYVAAVVAAEYGFDDLEGAKAMAVIVRTYTMATLNKYGSNYDHVDHTLSQVYHGTEGITPTIREAVRQTQGEVLRHDGELIEAVYFAASGGHTADNEDVWSADALPYLRGIPDPYGKSGPQTAWTSRILRASLLAALSEEFGNVTGFVVAERGDDGRVISVELLKASGRTQSIMGNEFRMLVVRHFDAAALPSTLFTVQLVDDEYVFEGSGSGHGVGLSQWGAHELARRNSSYEDILDFYYTDVQLEQLDDSPVAAKMPSESRSEPGDPSFDLPSDPPTDLPANQPVEPARRTGRIGW